MDYGVKFKKGVVVKKLLPPMVGLVNHLAKIARGWATNIVITSANDGKHREGSKHYTNEAFDIRIWNMNHNQRVYLVEHINFIDGERSDYDAVLERDHIHAEYDPK